MWKINRKDKFLNSGILPEDIEEVYPWDDNDDNGDTPPWEDDDTEWNRSDPNSDADNYL